MWVDLDGYRIPRRADTYVGRPERVQILDSPMRASRSSTWATPDRSRSVRDQRADPCRSSRRSRSASSAQPGHYQAPVRPVPARGLYVTLHRVLSGTLEGVEFDLTLTSGPKTFDEVQDLAGATFPPVDAPTNADLASRIQRESDRHDRSGHRRDGGGGGGTGRRRQREDDRHRRHRRRRHRSGRRHHRVQAARKRA